MKRVFRILIAVLLLALPACAVVRADTHSFTTQPSGGTVMPDRTIRLTWKTNFTPVKVVIGSRVGLAGTFTGCKTLTTGLKAGMSYDLPYNDSPSGPTCIVRAFYDTGAYIYVDSAPFTITKVPRRFDTSPAGGGSGRFLFLWSGRGSAGVHCAG